MSPGPDEPPTARRATEERDLLPGLDMKRAALIVCLAVPFAIAGGQAGCGSGTLGGNGGSPPTTGFAGGIIVGSGEAGAGGPGNGGPGTGGSITIGTGGFAGDIAPPQGGRGGAAGVGGFTAGTGGRGRAGSIGTGGFGGEFGPGGTSGFCTYTTPDPPVCGSARCGNGAVDSCPLLAQPGCQVLVISEDCDGGDFGSDSCAARGYPSGSLVCNADCTTDARCSPCAPGPSTIRCGAVSVSPPNAVQFGLAATDTEVAYAAVTQTGDNVSTLWFTRLSRDLDATSVTVVDDTSQAGSLYGQSLYWAAAAPLPSGWVAAVCADREIYIHTFDANGQDAGRVRVASFGTNDFCIANPVLAASPGGQVVLAWPSYAGGSAAVIAADGRSVTTPQAISTSDQLTYDGLTAAWIGDAFYVGVPIYPHGPVDTSIEDLRIIRVTTDGQVSTFGDDFSGFYGGATFAAGAGDFRVVYLGVPPGGDPGYDIGVIWQRIAPDHTELMPVTLGMSPDYGARSPAVAFGDDTVVLVSGGQQRLALARVALDGTVLTPTHDILVSPNYEFNAWDMVRRGPDVIVGWVNWDSTQPIGLARLTP